MSYQDGLANFLTEFQWVIIWLGGTILFVAMVRGILNLFLGLKVFWNKHKLL